MLCFDDVTDKNGNAIEIGDTVHTLHYKSYWDDEYYEDPNDYKVTGYEFIQEDGVSKAYVFVDDRGDKVCLSPRSVVKVVPSIPDRLRGLASDLRGEADPVVVANKLVGIANEMEEE